MIDLHVHTRLCGHAEGDPAEYLAEASVRGVSAMAFSDHLPLLDAGDTDYAMSLSELPGYVESVRALEPVDVEVLLGVEADWIPGRETETAALLGAHDFDVVLGSVHFLDGWAFDDPRHRAGYAEWDVLELWERYFEAVVAAAGSGLFDVMAHLDLVKKFGTRPAQEPTTLFSDVAAALAGSGVAIEISTAGLRKPVGEIYPSETLLRTCRRAGVPVTIGSDAHRPSEVGYEYAQAVELAGRVGYDTVRIYRAREPVEVAL